MIKYSHLQNTTARKIGSKYRISKSLFQYFSPRHEATLILFKKNLSILKTEAEIINSILNINSQYQFSKKKSNCY